MQKPNKIITIIPSFRKFLPPKSFKAIMMFGKLFINIRDKEEFEKNEREGKNVYLKNHEMIHVKQAITTSNSWFLFYILYIWYWFKNLPLINGFDMPYKFIPFELEAYYHEDNLSYCEKYVNGTENYKHYKFSLKEKRKIYKEYKEMKKIKFITFHDFLHKKFSF